MGIRGLSAFIESEPNEFFKFMKLHDLQIVIDGNCIASWLFKKFCAITSIFNGDYEAYGSKVEFFFWNLNKCNIKPIVIFDGGHESKKLNCVVNRMEENTRKINEIKSTRSNQCFLPLLVIETFKNVMMKMNIRFYQSILEADSDIAQVAQFLDCPILSYDSDFYFFDIVYLPFSYFNFETLKFRVADDVKSSTHYISGKCFLRENFLRRFGGIPDLSFLQLSSAILGNDYYDADTFVKFFENISSSDSKKILQRGISSKITILFKWFRDVGSPQLAIKKIVELVPAKMKKCIRKDLKRYLIEKQNFPLNYLVQYMQQLSPALRKSTNYPVMDTKHNFKWLNDTLNLLSYKDVLHKDLVIPFWVLQYNIEGKFHSAVMDLLFLNCFFLQTQMEHFSFVSASSLILPILQHVAGIVFNEHLGKDCLSFCVYFRINNSIKKKYLEPLYPDCSVTLTTIPLLSLKIRENIMLSAFKMKKLDLTTSELPENWILFLLMLAYWHKNESSSMRNIVIGCIIFSCIFLSVVDKKIGYIQNEVVFLEKYLKILNENRPRKDVKLCKRERSISKLTVAEVVEQVDYFDCVLAVKYFISLRTKSDFHEKLFKPVLHSFAQIQNCFFLGNVMNSILNFPLLSLKSSDIFCGTLVYNIFFEIKTFKNLEGFINNRFCELPTLKILFLRVVAELENLCETSILTKNFNRSHN